ncbi:MAG: TIGR00159 family protein [Deltaproteobacteria bacterium]|nr:TIGR00159 family protein [Deltaproteobacteria bacterium]
MPEGLLHLFAPRPLGAVLRDLGDIFVVAFIFYELLRVMRGTRAMQMGIGFFIFGLVYLVAKYAGLGTLLTLLSWIAPSLLLLVVVLFQNDIRRALIRVGAKALLTTGREQQTMVIDEVVAAATELARHRMGAIIALEQDANILEFVRSEGIAMESLVTRELLVSLFIPEAVNKTHDGAVVIRNLKIARAGVFFPMPETKITDTALGSRHRAAIGITEETDAVVVVVSEERGTISMCFNGNLAANLDGESLRRALLGLFGRPAKERGLMSRMSAGLRRQAEARAPESLPAGATTPTSARPEPAESPPSLRAAPPSVQPSATEVPERKPAGEAPVSLRVPEPAEPAKPEAGIKILAKTPPPPRVSRPMPKADEHRPLSGPPSLRPVTSDEPPPSARPAEGPSAAVGGSRPMAQSDGPPTSAKLGGEEP